MTEPRDRREMTGDRSPQPTAPFSGSPPADPGRDENGTHADLMLMPPSAFTPEPIILQNIAPDTVLGVGVMVN